MVIAVGLAIFSGLTIVLARIANAKLGEISGPVYSSFMNYLVGLTGSLIIFFVIGGAKAATAFPAANASVSVYFGGAMGLCAIYLSNLVTHKLTSIQMTLLLFIGQLFSGIIIDIFQLHIFSPGKLVGGILVLAGMLINMQADREKQQ